ncbi:GNAT family N-acetyltransferase [Clostridium sp. CF012]|uniref:GNAT family N-acetyltransferase n=1 Tax=Clostridium sp. CF012 TaxID=2843319 RepID=UPI001C0D10F7|nr:GNAT family N-acetyltransferase [Clostridium sp. CF012]MBU3143774.1 GNAT family N-acetyltransferase [Clostridium sp. CF012]
MIFQSKGFYIDLVQNKDLKDIVEVYNSNKYFLINHMDIDNVKYEWILEELESMKKANFYSCKVVEKSSDKIIGIVDFKIGEETYVSLLMIHNDYKNKGFGKLIYRALEEYVKSVKSKCMRVDVVIKYDDTVLNFWVENGFIIIEDIELNWTGKILPAVIMRKFL